MREGPGRLPDPPVSAANDPQCALLPNLRLLRKPPPRRRQRHNRPRSQHPRNPRTQSKRYKKSANAETGLSKQPKARTNHVHSIVEAESPTRTHPKHLQILRHPSPKQNGTRAKGLGQPRKYPLPLERPRRPAGYPVRHRRTGSLHVPLHRPRPNCTPGTHALAFRTAGLRTTTFRSATFRTATVRERPHSVISGVHQTDGYVFAVEPEWRCLFPGQPRHEVLVGPNRPSAWTERMQARRL